MNEPARQSLIAWALPQAIHFAQVFHANGQIAHTLHHISKGFLDTPEIDEGGDEQHTCNHG
jgi:hypothetical protein